MSFEKYIKNQLLNETANLKTSETGLEYVIYISSNEGVNHGPRVKVSNIKGKFAKDDNFTIKLNDSLEIVGESKINLEFWNNKIDQEELQKRVKSINTIINSDIKLNESFNYSITPDEFWYYDTLSKSSSNLDYNICRT